MIAKPLLLPVFLLLTGCASLEGIPPTLDQAMVSNLSSGDLNRVFEASDKLSEVYQTQRDENLKYAFWSNVPFVPLGATGAGGLYYKAHKDLIAAVAIIAGSLAGLNTFVNARANAKVYQGGMNTLSCIQIQLGPYTARDVGGIKSSLSELEGEIETASDTLASAEALTFKTADELAEIKANPTVVTTLAAQEKLLTQAISSAQKVATDAASEITLSSNVALFAADAVRQVNSILSSKITQPDISFSALQSSITTLLPTQPAASGGAPKKAAAAPAAEEPTRTPIAAITRQLQRLTVSLASKSQALQTRVDAFGLSKQEKGVTDCIKT